MQPPLITPPPSIRTSWQPRQPRGRAIPGPRRQSAQGIRLQPPADTPPPDPPPPPSIRTSWQPRQPRGRAIPGPRRQSIRLQPPLITPAPSAARPRALGQSAQGIRLQPPADNPAAVNPNILATPADNPAAVNPNILATPATPRACYPWPGRQSAQGIRLQPPPLITPLAIRTLATPAGVLSLARGVNQRKESGCNPPPR